jgi:hypothetical protein
LWVVDTQPVVEGTGGPLTVTVPMGNPQLHGRAHPPPVGDKSAPWHDVAAYRYQPSPTVPPRYFEFGVVDSGFEAHPGLQVLEIVPGATHQDAVVVASNKLWFDDPVTRLWDHAHTLFVDQERGWLYISRARGGQSFDRCVWVLRISDFDNTSAPVIVAQFPGYLVQETYARKDRAYLATEANPLDQGPVWDVMDLTAVPPMMLSITPQWLAARDPHTLWVSEDEALVAATVEAQPGLMALYSVASPPVTSTPPVLKSTWLKYPHAPHIVQGIGRTLYLAHYTDGLHVLDATVPQNPVDFAYHDTYTFHEIDVATEPPPLGPALPNIPECGSYAGVATNQWYYGAWDCYPYQDSGLVYVSDTRGGLFILEIGKGHFLRSQDEFPLSTWVLAPDLHPHGATPKPNWFTPPKKRTSLRIPSYAAGPPPMAGVVDGLRLAQSIPTHSQLCIGSTPSHRRTTRRRASSYVMLT